MMVSVKESQNNVRRGISIQIGLNGYSFKVQGEEGKFASGWLSPGQVFTTKEFLSRYDLVEIALFTPKCTLVPSDFFVPQEAKSILSGVTEIADGDAVSYVQIPEYGAVLVYSNSLGENLSRLISDTVLYEDGSKALILPETYFMLTKLRDITDYNKISASYCDGRLYLVIAQGKTLLLCNSFAAADFTTAEYFIFLSLKRLQLNPEVSSICFRTPLTQEQEMSLYRYFRSVEQL